MLPAAKSHANAHALAPAPLNLLATNAKLSNLAVLNEIIEQRNLPALFQPIIDMQTGAFFGFEGLLRGPAHSPLHAPWKLRNAAEQHGLSVPIEQQAQQILLATFMQQALPGQLFLNISAAVLNQPSFKHSALLDLLSTPALDCARLVIGIADQPASLDYSSVCRGLLPFRDMGCQIAVNDWGEGFSSVRLLAELRPAYLKLDKHFVQGLDRDASKQRLLASIQNIAAQCGTQLLADGIASEAELRLIRELGISFGQGDFIARPSATPPLQANSASSRIICASNSRKNTEPTLPQRNQATAFKLLSNITPAHPDELNEAIFARFSDNAALRVIPVVSDGTPLGLINRYQFMDRFAKPFQRELLGKKPCREVINAEPLLIEKNMPIEELSHFMVEADSRHFADGFIITEQGRYIGVAFGQDLLRELTQMQLEAARYANPLTLLPGNVPINQYIERLLENHTPFVACYCDLDHFKPFNDIYSYRKGDEMIQLTGHLLNAACDPLLDFIGHIGGDDFILVMQSPDWQSRCENALNAFATASASLFKEAHLMAGGYHCDARNGAPAFYPLTSLSIGALKVAAGQFTTHHEVSAAMSGAKKMAKEMAGNSLFVEQRDYTKKG